MPEFRVEAMPLQIAKGTRWAKAMGGILAGLLLLCAGCHRSGTWTDDPKNWKRAFGGDEKPPEGIKVVHSSYWRSPHFTREDEFFFQLEMTKEKLKQTQEGGTMVLVPSPSEEDKMGLEFPGHEKPAWFIPKPLEQYEIWKGDPAKDKFSNFWMLIDRETQAVFMTDYSY